MALHALETATASFIVPLTSKIFLVARDTPQKRTEVEPHVAVSIQVPETLTPQDFNAMVTAVQQTFAVEKVAFDTANNTVILKGAISKIVPARAMFEDLLFPEAQVMVEVRFVEVSRNDLLTYGVDFRATFKIDPLQVQRSVLLQRPLGVRLDVRDEHHERVARCQDDRVQRQGAAGGADALARRHARHASRRRSFPILTSGYFGPNDFQRRTGHPCTRLRPRSPSRTSA